MQDFTIREANESDMEIARQWRNDPETRRMFRNGNVVSREENENWFRHALKDEKRVLLFIENDNDERICLVRFDEGELQVYEVSINMNPDLRGRGLCRYALGAALRRLTGAREVRMVRAEIKDINVASQKCFLANGFIQVSTRHEYYLYEWPTPAER